MSVGVPLGEWNVAEVVIGPPGSGKSFYANQRARELRATPAYVIVHDPTRSFRGRDVSRHVDLVSLGRGLASHPGHLHTLDVSDGEQVIRAGLTIAETARARRSPPVPTLIVLDEASLVGEISPSFLGPTMKEAYVLRRHRHVGFLIVSQRPQLLHPLLYEQSTAIHAFRITSERVLRRLEGVGVDRVVVERIPTLAKYERVTHTW